MSIRRIWIILIFALSIMVISGCSDEEPEEDTDGTFLEDVLEEDSTDEATDTAEEETESIPEVDSSLDLERFKVEMDDTIAWMKTGPGKYPGDSYDEALVKSEIDKWHEGLSAEEYFYRILALTAEDYSEYQQFLEETEVVFNNITARPDGEAGEAPTVQQPNLNIQVLLDASGSMAGQIDGEMKMDLAKEAIGDFAAELPANANISLRVYGHKGTNQLEGKEESCAKTEEVYSLGNYNESAFSEALNQFGPTGYTPLGLAIQEAGEDLLSSESDGENIIYVVSDGVETCGGDPVAEAKKLVEADVNAIVNIIGFDIEESEREALQAIADAGDGEYFTADTADELRDTFEQERTALINDWFDWESKNVNTFFDQESKYVNDSFDLESEAVNLSYDEEARQKELTEYMEEIMVDYDGYEVRQLIGDRAYSIRDYVRDEYYAIRDEARDIGYQLREQVRDEAYEEREDLRNED